MKQSDRKSESRKKIIEAAREVFFREDYMGASVDEIAARAGISKGAVYRHFDSKASLYVTVLAENGEIFETSLRARVAASEGQSSADRIRDIWDWYLDHWIEYPDHFRIFWAIDNESVIGELPTGLSGAIPEFWKSSLALSQALIDEGIAQGEFIQTDSWKVAHAFWAVATALIEHDNIKARRIVRQRPLRDVYQHSIELILRGILADPSRSRVPVQSADE